MSKTLVSSAVLLPALENQGNSFLVTETAIGHADGNWLKMDMWLAMENPAILLTKTINGVVLSQGRFTPPPWGTLKMSGDIFDCHA